MEIMPGGPPSPPMQLVSLLGRQQIKKVKRGKTPSRWGLDEDSSSSSSEEEDDGIMVDEIMIDEEEEEEGADPDSGIDSRLVHLFVPSDGSLMFDGLQTIKVRSLNKNPS